MAFIVQSHPQQGYSMVDYCCWMALSDINGNISKPLSFFGKNIAYQKFVLRTPLIFF